MTSKHSDAGHVGEGNLFPEPESMQKYSDEVRERIAKKAYELYEQRGRQTERHLEDWLEAEELIRKEMTNSRTGLTLQE
jgi:malic enzyme